LEQQLLTPKVKIMGVGVNPLTPPMN
jgi:hypothetical protein